MDDLLKTKFKEMIDKDKFTLEEVNHSLYCNNCHTLYDMKGVILHNIIAIDIPLKSSDFSLYDIQCKNCGNLMIVLDKEISEDIVLLNEKGYTTEFSCQGHSLEECSYIAFDDNTTKALLDKKIVPPDKWYYESANMYLKNEDTYRPGEIIILRSVLQRFYGDGGILDLLSLSYDDLYNETMTNLHNWVKELPDNL